MKKTIVGIASQTIRDGDAVGNDITGMYCTLANEGFDVGLISEYVSDSLADYQMDPAGIQNFVEDKDAVLIYHHSIFWEFGEHILEKFKGKIIFRFHNITPPHFFKDYSNIHYEKCLKGQEQTNRFIKRYKNSPWWGASVFNAIQLEQSGLDRVRTMIVPPFNRIDAIEKIDPNYKIIDDLIKNNDNNVLFIGRVVPNKGHVHLIHCIKEYKKNYDSNIHLWIIGQIDHDHLNAYGNQLAMLIKKFGLERNISFVGKIPENDIKSYYLGCDEYLCMSEHEGFCVPIIEAQQMMLPVITYGGSALRETTGKNQIILDSFDYPFAASALFTLFTDEKVRNYCKKHGLINAESNFSTEKIKNGFMSAFEHTLDGNQQ
jgi:glycosyltransferase involved in cell wall biosynthesis